MIIRQSGAPEATAQCSNWFSILSKDRDGHAREFRWIRVFHAASNFQVLTVGNGFVHTATCNASCSQEGWFIVVKDVRLFLFAHETQYRNRSLSYSKGDAVSLLTGIAPCWVLTIDYIQAQHLKAVWHHQEKAVSQRFGHIQQVHVRKVIQGVSNKFSPAQKSWAGVDRATAKGLPKQP
nr:hypothetical protein [uncultured Marinobacter sp.]